MPTEPTQGRSEVQGASEKPTTSQKIKTKVSTSLISKTLNKLGRIFRSAGRMIQKFFFKTRKVTQDRRQGADKTESTANRTLNPNQGQGIASRPNAPSSTDSPEQTGDRNGEKSSATPSKGEETKQVQIGTRSRPEIEERESPEQHIFGAKENREESEQTKKTATQDAPVENSNDDVSAKTMDHLAENSIERNHLTLNVLEDNEAKFLEWLKNDDVEGIKNFLNQFDPKEVKQLIDGKTVPQVQPLAFAISEGSDKILEYFLQAGGNPNQTIKVKDKEYSLLSFAELRKEPTKAPELLRKHGAEPDAKTKMFDLEAYYEKNIPNRSPNEKIEDYVSDFTSRFLHPYITNQITPENEPPNRKSMMNLLQEKIGDTGDVSKKDLQDIALKAYFEKIAQGLYVNRASYKERGKPIARFKTITSSSPEFEMLKGAIKEALPKDFPFSLSDEEIHEKAKEALNEVNKKNKEDLKEIFDL